MIPSPEMTVRLKALLTEAQACEVPMDAAELFIRFAGANVLMASTTIEERGKLLDHWMNALAILIANYVKLIGGPGASTEMLIEIITAGMPGYNEMILKRVCEIVIQSTQAAEGSVH